MTLVPQQTEVVDMPTLRQLADQANAAHGTAMDLLLSWAEHAQRVGAILRQAWERVPDGGWGEWCKENLHFTYNRAGWYMRTAVYWDQVQASGAKTNQEVALVLRGMPPLPKKRSHSITPKTAELQKVAKAKYDAGTPIRQIARELGCSPSWAKVLIYPELRAGVQRRMKQSQQRQKAARAALREKETRERARKVKGGVSKAYSNVRLMLDALDDALSETTDPVTRRAIVAASAAGRKAEEAISAALRGKEPAEGSMKQRAVPHTKQRGSSRGLFSGQLSA